MQRAEGEGGGLGPAPEGPSAGGRHSQRQGGEERVEMASCSPTTGQHCLQSQRQNIENRS